MFYLIGLQESQRQKSVWIIGSSIIKHAFSHARATYDGISLGLNRKNCKVWWQGKGGMRWDELVPKIENLLKKKYEHPPDILVIHCGGNNLGYRKLHKFRHNIRSELSKVRVLLPNCKIVWSQILPRLIWRASQNSWALNRAATRVNNLAAWQCVQSGGGYVKYPEIGWKEPGLFEEDGVHLSSFGNDLFLYRLQQFLQDFV